MQSLSNCDIYSYKKADVYEGIPETYCLCGIEKDEEYNLDVLWVYFAYGKGATSKENIENLVNLATNLGCWEIRIVPRTESRRRLYHVRGFVDAGDFMRKIL